MPHVLPRRLAGPPRDQMLNWAKATKKKQVGMRRDGQSTAARTHLSKDSTRTTGRSRIFCRRKSTLELGAWLLLDRQQRPQERGSQSHRHQGPRSPSYELNDRLDSRHVTCASVPASRLALTAARTMNIENLPTAFISSKLLRLITSSSPHRDVIFNGSRTGFPRKSGAAPSRPRKSRRGSGAGDGFLF